MFEATEKIVFFYKMFLGFVVELLYLWFQGSEPVSFALFLRLLNPLLWPADREKEFGEITVMFR